MKRLATRSPESGAIAVMVGLSFTALLALTALAVDAGYMYQARQKLQTAADAAVMAGLPDLSASTTTATSDANKIAAACGFSSGVAVDTSTARQLKVTISATEPLFFARFFGLSSKLTSATSIGKLLAAPAIFAGSNACTVVGPVAPIGLNFSGGAPGLTINGDLETNGGIFINNTLSGGGSQTYNSAGGCSCSGCPSAATGGGAFTFPFSYTTSSFVCANSTSLTDPGPCNPTGTLAGVYCCGGQINVNGAAIGPATATFVSANGSITFNSNTVNLTAAANGVIAYSGAAGTCSPAAVNVGNGAVTMVGSILAPNGCISVNTASLNLTGSLAGNDVGVQINTGTITSSGGAGNYQLYQ